MTEPVLTSCTEEKKIYFHQMFSRLNDRQKEAVFASKGPVLVLAGAGSGKTTVLVERIACLLTYGDGPEYDGPLSEGVRSLLQAHNRGEALSSQEQNILRAALSHNPVRPYKILAITFTNKAARELKERIIAKSGEAGQQIWACTFHSACLRMLRSHIKLLGYPSTFTVYDTDDQVRIVKAVLKEMNVDEKICSPKQILSRIGRLKDRLITPEEFEVRHPNTYDNHLLARIYPVYQQRLMQASAVDFDDIICLTVRLFHEHPEVLERYQNQFSYIMVDEYQDTNTAQFELVRLLAAGSKNLCVVGDDDQSIYRFRGATIENILNFEEQYPNCRTIRLEENYRSTPAILHVANKVIANNKNRKGKTLWTGRSSSEKVKLVQVKNDLNESEYIVSVIRKNVASGRKFSDHAVLYRINAQSNGLERMLNANRIPYRVFCGQPFLGRKEIKDVRAYLCLVLNPHDNERFLRVINEPKRSIGATTVEKMTELARKYDCSLFTVAERADAFQMFSGKTTAALMAFAAMIRQLQAVNAGEELDVLYDRMLELSGYETALIAQGDEGQTRLENIREFRSTIVDFMLREGKSPDLYEEFAEEETVQPSPLEKFLAETELSTDQDRSEDEDDCVTLMTIHSAKGLEFPVVFLPGVEENIFPSLRSQTDEEELEEERRLAYVALTRAKDELHVIHATCRMLYGKTTFNPLSRYAEEMGEEDVEKISTEPKRSIERAAGSARHSQGFGTGAVSPGGRIPGRSVMGGSIPGRSAGGQIPGRSFAGGGIPGRSGNPQSAPKKAAPAYEQGMVVSHPKFGEGEILSVTPTGNDQLLEVAFERAGVKKIMAAYAKMTVIGRSDG